MKTIEITAYKASELSEKAFSRAYSEWSANFYYPWYDEIEQCREGLLGLFPGARLDRDNNVRMGGIDDTLLELKGRRLAAWINSNVVDALKTGKCYSSGHKHRKSNMTFAVECPFSGMTVDCSALQPLLDFANGLTYPRNGQKWANTTLEDLIGDCFHAVKRYLEDDIEYLTSEDMFKEDSEENEVYFDKHGRVL